MTENNKEHQWEVITFAAAAMLMVTMGARQSLGLFVSPLNTSTGLGIVTISFAMAVNQFVWGAVQPFTGAVADRYGAGRVLVAGMLIFALSSALDALDNDRFRTRADDWTVIGHRLRRSQLLGIDRRGDASHPGEGPWHGRRRDQRGRLLRTVCLCAPVTDVDLGVGLDGCDVVAGGHHVGGAAAGACDARDRRRLTVRWPRLNAGDGGLWAAVKNALADRSYLLLHAGFFTCGFHIAFLVTHLPGEVDLCGLPAVGGELVAGDHWTRQHLRQSRGGMVCKPLPQQVRAFLDVRLARSVGTGVSRSAQNRMGVLPICRWARLYLASHSSARRLV